MKKINIFVCVLMLMGSMIHGAEYIVPTSRSTVDGDTFCGGSDCTSNDTIIIEGGARGDLNFIDFNGNGSYITIKNEDTNRVVITYDNSDPQFGILVLRNCKYVDLRGDNNPGHTYGILVQNDGTPSTPSANIFVRGESDHIKLGYLEITWIGSASGTASSGINVNDPKLTNAWTFDTFEIHHNYIHNTRYAGMYLGPNYAHDLDNCAGGCPYTANFSIHDNLIEDVGSYGFNLKSQRDGSVSYIYNNTIRRTALLTDKPDGFKCGFKVLYNYGSAHAKIYNNWIEDTKGPCLNLDEADHLVHDNILLGCGSNDDPGWGHGIRVHTYHYLPGRPDRTVQIYDNIIVEAKRYGISGTSDSDAYMQRNIITESGIGEASGANLTEGTGNNANVYTTDADDLCFEHWSDDNNYSNDDFDLCCDYPYLGSCDSDLIPPEAPTGLTIVE